MNREEFERVLDIYGGDLERWPAELAAKGRAFLEGDAAAQGALRSAQAVDHLLAAAVQPLSIDSATVGRIMAGIVSRQMREPSLRPTGRLLAWAGAAMAVCLVVGFVLGTALPSASDDDSALAALMLGNDTAGATIDAAGGIL